jgi:hypothetical protein
MAERGIKHRAGQVRRCAFALILSFPVLGTGRPACAQIVNVLQEAEDVAAGLSGKLEAGSQWLDGNADSLQVSSGGVLRYKRARHVGLVMARAAYGEAAGAAFIDQQLGHARYRLQLGGPLLVEAFLQGDRNPFRRRVLRLVGGAGPRAQLLHGPRVWSAVGLAYMPEYERLGEGAWSDAGDRRWRQRVSFYWSHTVVLGEILTVSHTTYLQPALGTWGNVRAFADLSLQLAVLRSLSLALSYSLQLDTRPPEGVRPADANRVLSLAWKF